MEHWKQHQDKVRQQLQQPPLQQHSQVTSNHNPTNKQGPITDPIQSIANVLNTHSKLVQKQQKKSQQQLEEQAKNKVDRTRSGATSNNLQLQEQGNFEASAQDSYSVRGSGTATSCAHSSSHQVDQGNSYLYAFNDFVTASRALSKDLKVLASSKAGNFSGGDQKLEPGSRDFSGQQQHNGSCEHAPAQVRSANYTHLQENLIDSEEEDALSYILHQQGTHFESLNELRHLDSITQEPSRYILNKRNQINQYLQTEENSLNSLEANRIDHHLSCSRSSHPRHICGIGGSRNDNINSIAARLKEESQRAFALNQKSHNNDHNASNRLHLLNNNIDKIQVQQFTHELQIIQDQLAGGRSIPAQQYNDSDHSPDTSYLNSSSELHLTSRASENCLLDKQQTFALGTESSKNLTDNSVAHDNCNSNINRPNLLPCTSSRFTNNGRRQFNPGFLSWFFCGLCSLFCASPTIESQGRVNFIHEQTNVKRGRHRRKQRINDPSIVTTMYTSSQQLAGQPGVYYTGQTPQADMMQAHAYQGHHQHQHRHHYPLSSDSSLGSSAFASSALRMNAFLRSCCSKKCLFISCLMLILLIFILVLGLGAYLNFLINLNRTNLIPLSGRLKVETQGDSYNEQLLNRTSREFIDKQQQYETILRGALDRTQNMLKSFPNHLVKCEVYSFKPGSLWVYFRFFINKRTLMQDTQLMKRKSPDEHFDKQFLPRLTQQTLHSGFEQLIDTFNRETSERRSRSSQTAELRRSRAISEPKEVLPTHKNLVKSFDDQISRLMPMIESIDLQSIQITPEFDMLQNVNENMALQQQSMSDNLRASQLLTTSSSVIVATGSNRNLAEYETTQTTPIIQTTSKSAPTISQKTVLEVPQTVRPDEIYVSTKKFTLSGYRENTTRPTTSSKPIISTSHRDQQDSLFLKNLQQKPSILTQQGRRTNGQSNSIITTRPSVDDQPEANKSKEKVVKLVSGQPVLSQNNQARVNSSRILEEKSQTSMNPSLFAPLVKLDQQSTTNISVQATSNQRDRPVINETLAMQMNAPYQKVEFSAQPRETQDANRVNNKRLETSIQELWDSALNISSKRNASVIQNEKVSSEHGPKRVITITSASSDKNQNELTNSDISNSEWQKISSDISETIRTQLNATTSTSAPSPITPNKPKISPHLKQGGSLISTQAKTETPSAVVLNREFQQVNNGGRETVDNPTTKPHSSSKPEIKLQRKPQGSNREVATAGIQRQRIPKPIIRKQEQQKPKKIEIQLPVVREETSNGSLINSKGIRIVDNFLATLDSNVNKTVSQSVVHNPDVRQNRNKTLEAFSFNADHMIPTLPTTIELTRSTTGLPPLRTTSSQPSSNVGIQTRVSSSTIAYAATSVTTPKPTTSTTVTLIISDNSSEQHNQIKPLDVDRQSSSTSQHSQSLISNQLTRPGTTSFSNQWKPIANSSMSDPSEARNRNSSSRPNLPVLASTSDRTPSRIIAPLNQAPQSPFAMNPEILDNQFKPIVMTMQNGRTRTNKLKNTYQHLNNHPNNDFESHRVSRMRQGTSTSTAASVELDSSTRIVDDFMITTDKIDGNTRSSTLLHPLVLSALHIDPLARMRSASSVDLHPKRTRGPFAFETLKVTTPTLEIQANRDESSSIRAERSSNGQGVDQKLLIRKRLFLGNEEEGLSSSSSGNPSNNLEGEKIDSPQEATGEVGNLSRFGNRNSNSTSNEPSLDKLITASDYYNSNYSFRCQYYGCKAKGSEKFTCLNYTQICDDFIDCQDESDELDCVSLLKHDTKSNKLSFSNGEGIIYLNRKGSLAPMCVDYFDVTDSRSGTSTAHELEAVQWDMMKKQQELIRQINTIGQYACSLQSFSRLVSVKINHHNLVDSSNLIKSSKLYHRLSIVGDLDKRESSVDTSSGSYKSANNEHEIEVSTSPDCPSQRTVFVKCGSFECGQDSFSVMDQNNSAKKKNSVIINDFPWLVKLYWLGSLSCHGYLIDELWLISSNSCFANRTQNTSKGTGWTAEISYEHYGNNDYQSIETNGRNIKRLLAYQDELDGQEQGSIVLAKLDKPIRFSPLNRPICLPPSAKNKTLDVQTDIVYKNCVTATLPLSGEVQPTQGLLLRKAKVHKSSDCWIGEPGRDLVCVSEMDEKAVNTEVAKDDELTRVLICSAAKATRSRPKWTVVGIQTNVNSAKVETGKLLFTTVSSQMSWIIDTMIQESNSNLHPDGNELNPINSLMNENQTCNRFKCSSGECLSWSRICDGLYDCSSHDDEKDCHK